jgi:hypothetical protein
MLSKITVHRSQSSAYLDQLGVDELCRLTGSGAVSVRRAALFWVLHGVLKEITTDTFYVLEHAEDAPTNQAIAASALESGPSNVQSTAEQAESEMQIYWYANCPS